MPGMRIVSNKSIYDAENGSEFEYRDPRLRFTPFAASDGCAGDSAGNSL